MLVVVVGAGISGLSAAKKSLENGCRVILIEAQPRIGGRIKSVLQNRNSGETKPVSGHSELVSDPNWTVLEDGAAWIHYTGQNSKTHKPNPVKVLADELKIATVEQSDYAPEIIDFNNNPMSFFARLGSGMRFVMSGAAKSLYSGDIRRHLEKHPRNAVTFGTVIDEMVSDHPLDLAKCSEGEFMASRGFAKKLTEFYLAGADPDNTSALPMLSTHDGSDHFLIGGYNRITDYLFESIKEHPRLTVHLNTSVCEISNYNNLPAVRIGDTIIECDAVILTIPAALIQKSIRDEVGALKFTPPLPVQNAQLINKIQPGNMLKVHFHFKTAFWTEGCQYVLPLNVYRERGMKQTWFSIVAKPSHKLGEHTLTVCFYGHDARFDDQTDDQIVNHAIALLKKVFKNFIDPMQYHIGHRWNQDPFAAGAWCSYHGTLTAADFQKLAAPIGSLYPAGDVTGADTTHMALLSGEAAANAVFSAKKALLFRVPTLFTLRNQVAELNHRYTHAKDSKEKNTIKANTLTVFEALKLEEDSQAKLQDLIALYKMIVAREFNYIGAMQSDHDKQGQTNTYTKLLALLSRMIQSTMQSDPFVTAFSFGEAKKLLSLPNAKRDQFFTPKSTLAHQTTSSDDYDNDDDDNAFATRFDNSAQNQ